MLTLETSLDLSVMVDYYGEKAYQDWPKVTFLMNETIQGRQQLVYFHVRKSTRVDNS